ncbi:MAG: hypothetical protein ACEQSC_00105 [Candidatus Nanopelagicaceae bacterium]
MTDKNAPEKTVVSQEVPTKIPTVHFVNGVVGGVGKSTFSKLVAEMYSQSLQNVNIVDLDGANPNVASVYTKEIVSTWKENRARKQKVAEHDDFFSAKGAATSTTQVKPEVKKATVADLLSGEQIVLVDDPAKAYMGDRLLGVINADSSIDTLVSMPSNIDSSFRNWLNKNNIDREVVEIDRFSYRVINWWVTDGSDDSMRLFANFIDDYPEIRHVMVANKGNTSTVTDWDYFTVSERLLEHFKQKRLTAISMGLLSMDSKLSARAQREHLTYSELMNLPNTNTYEQFAAIRIRHWLNENFKAIKSTGLFNFDSPDSVGS